MLLVLSQFFGRFRVYQLSCRPKRTKSTLHLFTKSLVNFSWLSLLLKIFSGQVASRHFSTSQLSFQYLLRTLLPAVASTYPRTVVALKHQRLIPSGEDLMRVRFHRPRCNSSVHVVATVSWKSSHLRLLLFSMPSPMFSETVLLVAPTITSVVEYQLWSQVAKLVQELQVLIVLQFVARVRYFSNQVSLSTPRF